jgi:hypothetical protein
VLKEGRKSAKHLRYRMLTEREDTKRLALGRAGHCFILDPDTFALDFAVYRGKTRRGKEWDVHCAANPGRTTVSLKEYQRCIGMRDALLAHPIAGPLITAPGEVEKTIQWTDPVSELLCKARLDKLTSGPVRPDDSRRVLFDLKTAEDVKAERFGTLAARYGYHVQMALYRMGVRALGIDPAVKLVAVEVEPPHDVAVFSMSDDVLYPGEEEIKELLAMVSAGLFSKKWPGRYETEEVPLELPRWVYPEDDAGIDLGVTFGDSTVAVPGGDRVRKPRLHRQDRGGSAREAGGRGRAQQGQGRRLLRGP